MAKSKGLIGSAVTSSCPRHVMSAVVPNEPRLRAEKGGSAAVQMQTKPALRDIFAGKLKQRRMSRMKRAKVSENPGGIVSLTLRNVENVELSLWNAAWRLCPDELTWAQLCGWKANRNRSLEVILQINTTFVPDGLRRSLAPRRVREALNEIAMATIERDYLRTELLALPEADDRAAECGARIVVDWPLAEAVWIAQSIASSSGEVGRVMISRIVVGPDSAILQMVVPERLRQLLASPASCSNTYSARVLKVLTSAYEAECRSYCKPPPKEGANPF